MRASYERYRAAQPEGRAADAGRRLLRSAAGATALLRVTGTNTDTGMSEGSLGGDYFRGGSGESGRDAKVAAQLAGRRRVKVGVAGVGDERGTAG